MWRDVPRHVLLGAVRAAVAFGKISMCNHSPQANADFYVDAAAETVTLNTRIALKAGDDVGPLGEPVDDLALALVAPLGAHDNHIGHADLLGSKTVCAIDGRPA